MDTQFKDTDIVLVKEDLGKNLYRKKTYYTLVIEQDVLANTKDEADKKFGEAGINHSNINAEITDEVNGVTTYMVDANSHYTDDEYAEENGDVEINRYVEENEK